MWLAGVGHFCVLIASFQVPRQLHWKEELARLSPLNRKVMWTYGATIVLCIVAFGVLTLVLHDELLRGDKAALALTFFIGCFWVLRLLVDAFYFHRDDWPRGVVFVVGHALLSSLFAALCFTMFALCVWHFYS